MPTNESPDPAAEAVDRGIERVTASVVARVELLGHKLRDAKRTRDVGSQIAKHALPAVAIAFALGAAAGLRRTGSAGSRAPGRHPVRSAAFAALTAFGLRAVRELALARLGEIARQWWAEHGGDAEADGPNREDPEMPRRTGGDPFAPFSDR